MQKKKGKNTIFIVYLIYLTEFIKLSFSKLLLAIYYCFQFGPAVSSKQSLALCLNH